MQFFEKDTSLVHFDYFNFCKKIHLKMKYLKILEVSLLVKSPLSFGDWTAFTTIHWMKLAGLAELIFLTLTLLIGGYVGNAGRAGYYST